MSFFLTVDLGNSRCKLRIFEVGPGTDPVLRAALDVDSRPGIARAVEAWLSSGTPPFERTGMCSVAAIEVERELSHLLAGTLEPALASGLSIACREPARVGSDRLFAARGATNLVGGSAIVLDAGTALTVDAVCVDRCTGAVFLGGAIAPGPALLADALARHTARLPRLAPTPGAHALGRDTDAAVQAGIVVGFRGTARELVERIAAEADLAGAALVITGGARGFLIASEPEALFGERRILIEPDLVHRGLIAALVELAAREHS